MNLDKAISYIYSFWNEINPLINYNMHDREFRNPAYTRQVIDGLGININREKNVVIVGSKGKGTTATMLAEILRGQGLKVGLFTSPHLERFTERIRINGQEITESQFVKYVEKIKPMADKIATKIPKPYYLGPNGLLLAIALKYFGENNTDINILESGRGGRYDDVFGMGNNVIITPIVLEHKHRLGITTDEVIKTKLGIIDDLTSNIVISKQTPHTLEIICEQFKHLPKDAKPLIYGRDHWLLDWRIFGNYSLFELFSGNDRYSLQVPTVAEYIGVNLSSSLTMAKELVKEINLDKLDLKSLSFNGRCEIISSNPLVVLDGAICRESSSYLVNTLEKQANLLGNLGKLGNKVAIVALPSDKDYKGVLENLKLYFNKIILTKSKGAQYPFFQETDNGFIVENDFLTTSNLDKALEQAKKFDPKIIGIIGTQSLIGESRKIFQKK